MPKKKVGLYLGAGSVGTALKEGKKVLALNQAGLASVEAKEAEIPDETLHWQALIRKCLRQTDTETASVCLSLADRDFIIRSLELPLMSRQEIEAALMYEVEKYIPFKPEELLWDCQYERVPKQKRVAVSFVGIRKAGLIRTKRVLEDIGLKAEVIEPACLSLARVLRSSGKGSRQENFALLDLTSQEAYLTFFHNDLPVFNRYLELKEKADSLDLEDFVEAVNFSFQYFRREFKESKLDKVLLLVSDPEPANLTQALKESLSLEVEKITPQSLTGLPEASVESLKALGSVSRSDYAYKFNPDLKEVAAQEASGEDELPSLAKRVSWRWGFLSLLAGLVVGAYFIVTKFVFDHILWHAQQNFQRQEKELALPPELEKIGWQDIPAVLSEKQGRIKELRQFMEGKKDLAALLGALSDPIILPEPVWLESLRLDKTRQGKYQAVIRGYVYQDDDYQESLRINDFVANLNQETAVSSLFEVIELSSVSRRSYRDFTVTQFVIELR